MHPTTLHPLPPNLDNHPVDDDDDGDDDIGDDDGDGGDDCDDGGDGDDDDGDGDGDDEVDVGKKFGECGGGVIHYIQGAPLAHPPPPTYHHSL